ncbi:MAG: ATP-dependent carboligase [Planctomycetota bacterium]|nr:MAG: ATP-dependent carboligase [Planctomycetota bacterium]
MKAKRAQRLAIVGASARAAAFSALRAGYEVVAADLFADADLAEACDATRVERYPAGLVDWLAATECDAWLYTGALENHPALVDRMAAVRPLLGNGGGALRRVRDPWLLQRELRDAGLRFPETAASPSGLPRDGSWLCKTYRGASGAGVWTLDGEAAAQRCTRQGAVCQQLVEGVAASAVFALAQHGARLLGVTRQVIGDASTGAGRWQYAGSAGPLIVGRRAGGQLTWLGLVLAERFELRGVVGVDFVLADEEAWVVEVNPRYVASSEIVEWITGESAIAAHVAACVGERIGSGGKAPFDSSLVRGKTVLFARRDVAVSDAFAAWARGEASLDLGEGKVADVPRAGETIARGRPVVTVFASAPAGGYDEALRQRVAEVERRLYGGG